jgi:UDP:flavonoid glycosyltransferase YjiC (YdhE family)
MPNKLFEAAYASLPICVSNLPEMAAFVERLGIGAVMDQTSPESIAETIMKVLANPAAYVPSERAQEILKREYSWTHQAESLLNVYRSFERVAA